MFRPLKFAKNMLRGPLERLRNMIELLPTYSSGARGQTETSQDRQTEAKPISRPSRQNSIRRQEF